MIASVGTLLKGMLYGAGMMYFLDPDRGRRRRAGVVDKGVRLVHEVEDLCEKGCRDLANRSVGLLAEMRGAVLSGPADDNVIAARVRSVLGHHVSSARGVDVSVSHGTVTLRGTVRPGEPETLIPYIEKIAGVRGVESALTTAGAPVPPSSPTTELRPGTRLLMTAGGGLLLANGLLRRGFLPSLLGTAGLGLIARGLTDDSARPTGVSDARGVSFQRSIRIAAPIEKVFDFVSDVEQAARFLPEVVRVENLGDGRIRWSIEAPGGVGLLSGTERVAESVENERIVWASEDGSPIRYVKEARFTPDGDGTRLDVAAAYEPPGGPITHAAAAFFGLDPKTQLERNLNRVKQYLEEVPQGVAPERRG